MTLWFNGRRQSLGLRGWWRKVKVTHQTTVLAGVSCSGKSALVSAIINTPTLQKNLELATPVSSTSKSELERYGYRRGWRRKGGTLLHVEINPDPARQARMVWLNFLRYSTDVSLVLVAPKREVLLKNIRSRIAERKEALGLEAKEYLYTASWLREQYSRFLENFAESYAPRNIFIYDQDSGLICRTGDREMVLQKIAHIYADIQ
jgi:hypothetical protein